MSRDDCSLPQRRVTDGTGKQLHLRCSDKLQLERFTIEIVGHHDGRIDGSTDSSTNCFKQAIACTRVGVRISGRIPGLGLWLYRGTRGVAFANSITKSLCRTAMVVAQASTRLYSTSPYICRSCASRRATLTSLQEPKRAIHLNYLRKQEDAKKSWQNRGEEIRAGKQQSMLATLESRGYVSQIAG